MANQKNDGSSSRPLNKSVIYEAIYQTKIITLEGFGNLREGYLQWGKDIYTKQGYRYFYYRDGDTIYKISSLQASPQDYILYGNLNPVPTDVPKKYASDKAGDGWSAVTGGATSDPLQLTSSIPHMLVAGDKIVVTSTDGTAMNANVVSVTDPLNIVTDLTNKDFQSRPGLEIFKNEGHTGYMTYVNNGTYYLKYWDPTVHNPDGSWGAYKTELPKASILDQKIEFVPTNETETPYTDPDVPKESIYYRHIPAASAIQNNNGEDLYDIVVNTPLSIHSAVRYNSHILRASTSLLTAGINGEYFYENDKPQMGQSTITLARQPQVADWTTVMF